MCLLYQQYMQLVYHCFSKVFVILTHFYNCLYFSSITGRISVPLYASYCVSKYGVEAFSDALRQEMQPWGIKVIVLEPGFFATKLSAPEALERDLRKGWDHTNKDLKRDYGEAYLKRGTDSYPCNKILYLTGGRL